MNFTNAIGIRLIPGVPGFKALAMNLAPPVKQKVRPALVDIPHLTCINTKVLSADMNGAGDCKTRGQIKNRKKHAAALRVK